jgi:hypothetical protein
MFDVSFRFGSGYIITLRIKGENPNLDTVMSFFTEKLPDISLKVQYVV